MLSIAIGHLRSSPVLRIWAASLFTLAGLFSIHGVVAMLAPFESSHPVASSWGLLALFLLTFGVASGVVLLWRMPGCSDGPATAKADDATAQLDRFLSNNRLPLILAGIVLVGVVLHIASKYYLTMLRPISCFSEIRFAWLEVERSRLPVPVRIASMAGHLLSSFGYVGMLVSSFAAVRHWSPPRLPWKDIGMLFLFTMLGAIYAGFMGSRNAMLAFLVMGYAGALLGFALRPSRKGSLVAAAFTLTVPLVIAVSFSTAIFSDRMYCGTDAQGGPTAQKDMAAERYISGFYDEFTIRPRPATSTTLGAVRKAIQDHCNVCGPTFIYLNHGLLNLAAVTDTELRGRQVLLQFFRTLPERLGLGPTLDQGLRNGRVYGPGGLPLAGAAFHDYGVAGLVLCGAFVGGLFGFSLRCMRLSGPWPLVGVTVFTSVFYVMFLANVFVGTSVISFPFIVTSVAVTLFCAAMLGTAGYVRNRASAPNHA